MGETVRTASVLEIYNEAMKVLGDEKKTLLVELARLKTKSFFKNNLIRGILLLGGIAFFISGAVTFFSNLSDAPISNIFLIAAALIFYFKKPALIKETISKTKSFLNNLHKNPGSGLIVLLGMYIGFGIVGGYFRILQPFLLLIPAVLLFYFYKNFTNLDADRIKEINNRLVAIDSEVEDLKKKKEAMLKQSLSEADEFLTNKN